MARGVELGVAYLTLAAETRGLVADIGKALSQGEKAAGESGRKIGQAIKKGVDSAQPVDTTRLTEKVEADQKRLAASVEVYSRKQEDATRKVEIAHQRLKEVREKSTSSTSQVMRAEEQFRQAINRSKDVAAQARAQQELYANAVSQSKGELFQAEQHNRRLAKSIEEAENKYKGFGGTVRKAMDEARASMKGSFSGAFTKAEADGRAAAKGVSGAFEKSAEDSAQGFGTKFSGAFKGLIGVAAGAGASIGASLTKGITDNLEQGDIKARMRASLGIAGDSAANAGKVTGELFKQGFGQSYDDVARGVSAVISSIPGIANEKELQGITKNILAMSDAMGIDATESAGALTTMLSSGLAKDGTEASQILAAGLQKIPEQFRGEAVDALVEYSDEFVAMGYTGEEAMTMLVRGAQKGQYGIDKTGDSIKEFQIRATDGSKSTADAFESIGLNATDMSNKILAGGDSARDARNQIVDALLGVKDPSAQAQAAIALFGTPLEDMNVTEIPKFLQSMQNASGGMGDFQGAAKDMTDQLQNSDANKIESFKRTIQQGWADAVGGLVSAMVRVVEVLAPVRQFLIDTSDQWGPFAAGIGIVAAAAGLWAAKATLAAGATWLLNGAIAVLTSPITWTIVAIGLLVGAVIYAYNNFEWFRNGVSAVWDWIKGVIAGFVDWWTQVAWPSIQQGLQWVGDKFTWLYENVVKPVWGWISGVISGFVGWLTNTAIPWVSGALQTLGNWFRWLNDTIIQPVWLSIRIMAAATVAVLMTIFDGLVWVIKNVLAPPFVWLYENVVAPVFRWISERIQGFGTWFSTVALPMITGAIDWLKQGFQWLWEKVSSVFTWIWNKGYAFGQWLALTLAPYISAAIDVVKNVFHWLWDKVSAVFTWISGKINAFATWFNTYAAPFIGRVIDNVKAEFQWLWDKISAVFNWATEKIRVFANWFNQNIMPYIRAGLDALKAAFQWLWEKVSAVWSWISDKISRAWNWVRDVVLAPAINWLKTVLGPAWDWVKDKVGRVWDWIGDKVSRTWNWVRDNVLNPMRNFLKNDVVNAFENAKDNIGRVWDKIKDKVKEPVRFVVDTVINGGFIKNYNKIADKFKVDPLPEVKLPSGFALGGVVGEGYARGGILPGYQVRKKDELLTPMRKGEGVLVPEAVRALGADFIHGVNGAANSGGVRGAEEWKKKYGVASGDGHDHGAPAGAYGWAGSSFRTSGAVPPSGGNGIWGSFQASASRAGAMSFPDKSFMGTSTKRAAQAWMGRSALNVNTDGKGPSVSVGYGNHGPWGFNAGSSVQVNPAAPRNMVLSILMHEFGHALSLDHTNNGASLMHPAIAGVRSPSPSDYTALVRAWGKPGEGVKTYDVNGGESGFSFRDVLQPVWDATVGKLVNSAMDGLAKMFPGNHFVGIGTSAVKKIVQGGFDFILGAGEGANGGEASGADWSGTVKDALKRTGLPVRDDYVNAWVRQIQTESGGNPRAVQGGYTDINTITGDLAQGLVQVIGSTFRAYRDPSLPNDRFDPLANLVAAMNYAKARYGTSGLLGVIGKGHGYALGGIVGERPGLYDKGGLIQGKGLRLIDHQRSTPDYVLTSKQWDAMYQIAERSVQSGNHISVSVPEREGISPDRLGMRIGEGVAWELSKIGV